MAPRVVNASLGLWLYLSAFLWPHTRAQVLNAWIAGLLAVAVALTALDIAPRWRYLNIAIGVWLVASSLFLPGTNLPTLVNHVVVGAGLGLFASIRGFRPTQPSAAP